MVAQLQHCSENAGGKVSREQFMSIAESHQHCTPASDHGVRRSMQ
jgi:hypothetical protein